MQSPDLQGSQIEAAEAAVRRIDVGEIHERKIAAKRHCHVVGGLVAAMVSLRKRSVWFSILAGSSARLMAASTLSVTPLAGLGFGFIAQGTCSFLSLHGWAHNAHYLDRGI